MKKIIPLILFVLCATAYAQQSYNQPNLGLIPTPQKVEMAQDGKTCAFWKAKTKEQQVKFGRDGEGANYEQMYGLTIEPQKITIRYEGKEGLDYAYKTLYQLRILYGDSIPCCTITDWPAYRYRGWMDDQSRGPVPHALYRTRQWFTLNQLKYNFCNYYTEHTLYQKEYPDLAPAYADEYPPHDDEVVNLQLFAHAEKTLRIPYYQHLMDSRANFNPDNEATYDFLFDRIVAAMKRIPYSPFFIINCDETEQLGSGRAKRLVDSLGADQVYVDHINRCCELIELAHYRIHHGDLQEDDSLEFPRVVMWGDIVAKNPAMMKQLPEEMTYIMWAYEPLDSYDHLIKPFKDNGTPFWVAPSLSHSGNMIPSPQRYMKNIANLARDGYKAGAEGLMNTCWDDNGEALFDNCWHGLYWSAEMAWNPLKSDDPEEFRQREDQFNRNFERLFYSPDNPETPEIQESPESPEIPTYNNLPFNVSTLYQIGALEGNPDVGDWYTSAALLEPLLNFNPENTLVDTNGPTRPGKVSSLIKSTVRLDGEKNPHAQYAVNRMVCTMEKSLLRSMLYYYLNNLDPVPDSAFIREAMQDYLGGLFNLKREYLRLWDQENGEYERYIVCNRYDDLAREVLELDRHVFMDASPANLDEITNSTGKTPPLVKLRTLFNDRPIYYTLDGSEPTTASTRYTGPFPLERSATVKAVAYNEYGEGVVTSQYLLSHLGMVADIGLQTPYSTYKTIYSGGGIDALNDGRLGSNTTYADGHWQGYWGDSIDVILNFQGSREIRKISMRFMQNTFDWILAPKEIKVYVDGLHGWELAGHATFDFDPRDTGMRLRHCSITFDKPLHVPSMLNIVVPNPGPLPAWHPAPGQPSYLFTDEIIIQ